MGRHHSPDQPTGPIALAPARGSRRAVRRSPRREALRHGAVALGLTGTALAAVVPGSLQQAEPSSGAAATLALSAQDSTLPADAPTTAASPTRTTGSAVAPVAEPSTTAASSDLVKASDRVRRATPAPAAPTAAAAAPAAASTSCGASSTYGGVAPGVKAVGNALECVFPGHDMLGVGSRGGGKSDHPGGYALDMMTRDGDAIAACVLKHADELNVSYVIWNQRINMGSGWKGMEDRGGDTANHKDHVHISFDQGGKPDVSVLSDCG